MIMNHIGNLRDSKFKFHFCYWFWCHMLLYLFAYLFKNCKTRAKNIMSSTNTKIFYKQLFYISTAIKYFTALISRHLAKFRKTDEFICTTYNLAL